MEIKDYLYILDKGEFDAEIDPFLSGGKKIGRFSNLSGIALQYLTIPTTSASAERRQKKTNKHVISFSRIANALQIQ